MIGLGTELLTPQLRGAQSIEKMPQGESCAETRKPALSVLLTLPAEIHVTLIDSKLLASCALTPGTVADGLLERPTESPANVVLEHASGTIEVLVDFDMNNHFTLNSAGLLRTARKLADGHIYVPASIWKGR